MLVLYVTLQVKHTICYNKLVFFSLRPGYTLAICAVLCLWTVGTRVFRSIHIQYITGPSVCDLLLLYTESLSMAVI